MGNSRPARSSSTTNCICSMTLRIFWSIPFTAIRKTSSRIAACIGGAANYTLPVPLGAIQNEISVGGLTRYDLLGVGRLPERGSSAVCRAADRSAVVFQQRSGVSVRRRAPMCRRPRTGPRRFAACSDFATTISTAPTSTIWRHCTRRPGTPMAARQQQSLLQPKGSLIYTPTDIARVLLERRAEGFTAPICAG